MEGIFTLPYSEYDVINIMSKLLGKSEGYFAYIPVSRQQKGVDFIIHSEKSNKYLKVQVKSSRSYIKNNIFFFWFNNFVDKYKDGNADLYILYGLYPSLNNQDKVNSKQKAWSSFILCFSEKEMNDFLNKVKNKKTDTPNKFFGIQFEDQNRITTERGFNIEQDLSKHLLSNYIKNIKEMLK
jgi:hypothetical protein